MRAATTEQEPRRLSSLSCRMEPRGVDLAAAFAVDQVILDVDSAVGAVLRHLDRLFLFFVADYNELAVGLVLDLQRDIVEHSLAGVVDASRPLFIGKRAVADFRD